MNRPIFEKEVGLFSTRNYYDKLEKYCDYLESENEILRHKIEKIEEDLHITKESNKELEQAYTKYFNGYNLLYKKTIELEKALDRACEVLEDIGCFGDYKVLKGDDRCSYCYGCDTVIEPHEWMAKLLEEGNQDALD